MFPSPITFEGGAAFPCKVLKEPQKKETGNTTITYHKLQYGTRKNRGQKYKTHIQAR